MTRTIKIIAIVCIASLSLFARVKVTPNDVDILANENSFCVTVYWTDSFLYAGEPWQSLYQENIGNQLFTSKWGAWKNDIYPTSFLEGINSVVVAQGVRVVKQMGSSGYAFNVNILSVDPTGVVEMEIAIVNNTNPKVILMTVTGIVGSSSLEGTEEEVVADAFKNAGIIFAEKVLEK